MGCESIDTMYCVVTGLKLDLIIAPTHEQYA